MTHLFQCQLGLEFRDETGQIYFTNGETAVIISPKDVTSPDELSKKHTADDVTRTPMIFLEKIPFFHEKAASHEATIECVSYAEDAGLYNVENGVVAPCTQMGDESQPHGTHLVTDTYL
ncbi:hypothetical protein B0H13DRAFT_1913767 [Mycena leptocephala]|nr:hypothetical protein B0H13DRAFT_1913767 [Mycena leptocephala]